MDGDPEICEIAQYDSSYGAMPTNEILSYMREVDTNEMSSEIDSMIEYT